MQNTINFRSNKKKKKKGKKGSKGQMYYEIVNKEKNKNKCSRDHRTIRF